MYENHGKYMTIWGRGDQKNQFTIKEDETKPTLTYQLTFES